MWDEAWIHQGMMGGDAGWSWLGMGLHGLFWLLIVGLVVASLVLVARGRMRPAAAMRQNAAARDILDARYARGDIDRDEYLARKQALS